MTERQPPGGETVPLAVSVVGTLLAYLAWLGWDQPSSRQTLDSPRLFEPWQIVGLALTLGVVAGYMVWRRSGILPVAVIPLTLAVVRAIDAFGDAAFWPLDALYAGLGGGLVALFAVTLVRPLRRKDSSSTSH